MKGTKIYGDSDDNIYFDGELNGQVSDSRIYDSEFGKLILLSDGSLLEVNYPTSRNELGLWEIKVIREGVLFDRLEICEDDEADIYSDIAYFKEGIKYGFVCYDLINPNNPELLKELDKWIKSDLLGDQDKIKMKGTKWYKVD